MKKARLLLTIILATACCFSAGAIEWKARWISQEHCQSTTNSWLAFKHIHHIDSVPSSVVASIAADSRYWLWINGEPVVREGGLKRGPAPGDSYFDRVEIAPYLKQGDNIIAVLVWHFGKNGFSHLNSGTAALLFQAEGEGVEICSQTKGWQCSVHKGFGTALPLVNRRLPESSIRYEAGKWKDDWYRSDSKLGPAIEIGVKPGEAPFGRLVERPIPMWKDYGLTDYPAPAIYVYHRAVTDSSGNKAPGTSTYECLMPYNAQVHPYLKVTAPAGRTIRIYTDHSVVTGEQCVTAEYVTKEGTQEFECWDWMNGQKVFYEMPEDVTVEKLACRQTGYDCNISGDFRCDDPFLNDYWDKAARTLYVCMRDTYYDCPDRERAQWWGDEVNEMAEAFRMLSPSSALLGRKGILELAAWQKPDGVMYSPIPCGNWYKELPMQILASVGWYGFHDWWMGSGDSSIIPLVYPAVHRYLHEVWELDADGLPIYRKGGWNWPDAGTDCDAEALLHPWYYLALKGEAAFARELGRTEDAEQDEAMMRMISDSFEKKFWKGDKYRSDNYTGADDDRVQAMAIVSGLASEDKYPALVKVIEREYHATTYMERYVLDALFIAGEAEMALERMRKLYPTVMQGGCSTLWEHWNWDGTNNHAWTGGGIIALSQRVAGISPLEPGYKVFEVKPQMGGLKKVEAWMETSYGMIEVFLSRKGRTISATLRVPEGTTALVHTGRQPEPESFGPGCHKFSIKVQQ
ncbi:MAG: glycoside hydrolase [Bacteroidales bacterium]|nr:glycoside hydrolase [Bacteroidales bacterium]